MNLLVTDHRSGQLGVGPTVVKRDLYVVAR